ncbi:alanine racemase [Frigoriflavimonas asaccharolytica]|uniref:Alanine racemase n=1 Tax=Frigoriflavimonas asaccharolytica TaxID=2735899 RepID=A0A8J8G6D7_9FLAO|nr:alanine racemase [Frigoriflavimonas asaccharolytica]NRS91550.1 alanine racemase [Frigoriflavimonas asaccharolytica]
MQSKLKTTSWLELSKSALKNNIDFIQNMLGEKTILSSVVKGNAYGHDIETYCQLAYDCGVRHFSLYGAQEAERFLNAINGDYTLLILGNLTKTEMIWAIENGVEFYIINISSLERALKCAKKLSKSAKIHLEFETGMNRTGIDFSRLEKVISLIKENENLLEIKGVCTHLAGSESVTNFKRIADQIKVFKKIKKRFATEEHLKPLYHVACSAGILRYPKYVFDMARVGILQYGYFPNNETFIYYALKNKIQENPLKRVISWKTNIIETKIVKAGEFIGYGTAFYTNIPTKIAILPVGYAFGYARGLSNQGKVLINGNREDVIGTINMNMLTIDITNLPNAKIGDEVVLIGKQGDQELTVSSFSEFSNQLNYELLARLPMDIERRIVD